MRPLIQATERERHKLGGSGSVPSEPWRLQHSTSSPRPGGTCLPLWLLRSSEDAFANPEILSCALHAFAPRLGSGERVLHI